MSIPTLARAVLRKNIEIYQNATFRMGMLVVEYDANGDPQIVDTSGWRVYMNVKKVPEKSEPAILKASTDNGRIIVGTQGDPGREVNIDITIPAGDSGGNGTASLTWFGCAGYDILAVYPDGHSDYYLAGQATLSPPYTWED